MRVRCVLINTGTFDIPASKRTDKVKMALLSTQTDSQADQYIMLKDGILKFDSCNITSKRGVYFTVHSPWSIWTNC